MFRAATLRPLVPNTGAETEVSPSSSSCSTSDQPCDRTFASSSRSAALSVTVYGVTCFSRTASRYRSISASSW
jgi:hypothetical protein